MKYLAILVITGAMIGLLVTPTTAEPSWFTVSDATQDSSHDTVQSSDATAGGELGVAETAQNSDQTGMQDTGTKANDSDSDDGSFLTLAVSNQQSDQTTVQSADVDASGGQSSTVQENEQTGIQTADNTAESGDNSFITIAASNQDTDQTNKQNAETGASGDGNVSSASTRQDNTQTGVQDASNTAESGDNSFITIAASNQNTDQHNQQDADTGSTSTNTRGAAQTDQSSDQTGVQTADNTAESGDNSFITIAASNQDTDQVSYQDANTHGGIFDGDWMKSVVRQQSDQTGVQTADNTAESGDGSAITVSGSKQDSTQETGQAADTSRGEQQMFDSGWPY